MKLVLLVSFLLLSFVLVYSIYDTPEEFNPEAIDVMVVNKNYTPSQNLNIIEGRFQEARKSIMEDSGKRRN